MYVRKRKQFWLADIVAAGGLMQHIKRKVRMDDRLIKWLVLWFTCAAGFAAVTATAEKYYDSEAAKAAMEHGYVQSVDPATGKVLWVKEKDVAEVER